jgi:quinoprotein glucose dehydrogenase
MAGAQMRQAVPAADWPTVGRDQGGARHSPLTQITPANVSRLQPAWVYHMKPAGTALPSAPSRADQAQAQAEQMGPPTAPQSAGGAGERPPFPNGAGPFAQGGRFAPSESIPLVVGGVMYLATPYSRIVALDAATGRERWAMMLPPGVRPATRGLEYWPGDGRSPPSLLFGASDGRLYAIAASDGKPVAGFGENGSINLRTPDVMVNGPNKPYSLSSPPIIFKNVVITGSAVGEAVGGSIGDVRSWDAATGKLLWTFHSVPRKGEPGYDSWGNDSGHSRSGVNVWGLMTVDPQRGIVYMPFGAPANDRIGVDRPGNNLYGTSIVAADATTGKYLWHFQITHHDIWDNDAEAPPTLIDVRRGGKTIPAVAIESKNGMLFILDRVTGKPVYPVVEKAVPKSDVPGEMTSPTQPFPTVTEPLARMSITENEIADLTPDLHDFCTRLVQKNEMVLGDAYTPPTYQHPMVYFPGTLGGVNWGGGSFDSKLGIYVVNTFALGQIMQIEPDGKGGFANRGAVNGRFWNPEGRLLCQSGSWGDLVGVNVNTGKVLWRSRLGVSDAAPPGKQTTGRPSIGGPITTATGLTFIAATDDGRFRAFETSTGRERWTVKLPASAHTNPITYAAGGKQFVALVSTGGSFLGTQVDSDALTAYALP